MREKLAPLSDSFGERELQLSGGRADYKRLIG